MLARLPNPARDADAVADMFKKAGYEVSLLKDAGNLEFKRNIRKFEDMASDADIAVVFYAGHGIEIGGTNYAIPVDAKLASDRDAADEAIELTRIIQTVDGAKRLRLVILDACRDNPFLATMKRQRQALRQVASGLGPVGDVGSETLVAYAAKQGLTAEDGKGDHSPFTTAILHNLPEPGLDIRLAFGRVRDEVLKITSQPPGALCLRLARRQQRRARPGAGERGPAGRRSGQDARRLRAGDEGVREGRLQDAAQGVPGAVSGRPLFRARARPAQCAGNAREDGARHRPGGSPRGRP